MDKCYHSDTYIKAYQHALQSINGPHEWKKSELEPILPPHARKMLGRPKKNRRKSNDESKKKKGQLSRKGLVMTCRNCGQEGHNRQGCQSRKSANVGYKMYL